MNLPSTSEIIEDIEFLDDWESRYQYIIDLGKALPELREEERTPDLKVKGCQADVWMVAKQEDGLLTFRVYSNAAIVSGLLAIVMAAYNEKKPQEITEFDIDGYFAAIDLENHLSPTRGNGLRAIVGKIKAIAAEAA